MLLQALKRVLSPRASINIANIQAYPQLEFVSPTLDCEAIPLGYFESQPTVTGQPLAADIDAGDVIIVRQALQQFELASVLEKTLRQAAKQVFTPAVCQQLQEHGWRQLHQWAKPVEMINFYQQASNDTRAFAVNLMAMLAYHVLGQRQGFFAETEPNLRTIAPFDTAHQAQSQLKHAEKQIGRGKITVHGPHQDSWFYHPLNTLNVWLAIEPVQVGNGLSLYPQAWQTAPKFDGNRRILPDQPLGRALNFTLQPGDLIIFSAEHVHGSELNQTQDTRCILSMRMTLAEPNYHDKYWYDYRQVSFVDNQSRLAISEPDPRWLQARKRGRLPQLPNPAGCAVTPTALSIRQINAEQQGFLSKALLEGQVATVSPKQIATRIHQQVYLLNRRCPHEGADLALGHVRNQQLVCPWHNLCFEPSTGKSPCQKLPALRSQLCEEQDGWVYLPQASPKKSSQSRPTTP